jgi:hypothetical protein
VCCGQFTDVDGADDVRDDVVETPDVVYTWDGVTVIAVADTELAAVDVTYEIGEPETR